MSGSAGSSYYSGGAGYDDACHGSEFGEGVYAGSKQANSGSVSHRLNYISPSQSPPCFVRRGGDRYSAIYYTSGRYSSNVK